MSGWWTDVGPSFAVQNLTTGLLQYSTCNSNNTPLYPLDPPNVFLTKYSPKNGTSLAATGWFDKTTTWASVFYQNNNDDLVNAIYTCDWTKGVYNHVSSAVISDRAGTPVVNPQTGLSVALLGEQEGYRVFFNDKNREMHFLKFTQQDSWSYGGPASTNSNRTGLAIHSQFSGVRNVSVVTPRDISNMETVRLNIDGTWHVSTFPTPLKGFNVTNLSNATSFPYDTSAKPSMTLEAWSGNPKALGLAVDAALTRYIFYVGTDSMVHSVAAFVTGSTESGWRPQPDQTADIWPKADEANGDFAIASDFGTSSIRLYYASGGVIHEANYLAGNWGSASKLNAFNTSAAQGGSGGSGSGLSTGAKAGVGVGVSLGVILLAGAAAGIWMLRKKRAADEEKALAAAAPVVEVASTHGDGTASHHGSLAGVARTGSGGSRPWDTDVKDKPATPTPRELESPNLASELPEHIDRTELPSDRNVTELP
ncbi:hypothetical protein B0T26DRAFT_747320 [Lasiosphaeria miniovina]|uniref:Fucose-specific lectin n=1 Tax=Lasiosphaeria miniovina TaxID=1954250 RepID=A0AA40B3P2_9PEZI|nr:uncharacterized protein B0T26DRAFT_747320 [Lasiosphaeria miniovina]KAK0726932.1 hypothetical protein B0T26DRAFT_747320 [Lasiosphaeria miniovina]